MQHKCKVTVIDKKLYPDLQERYLADPQSGVCPLYEVGQEFVFERYGGRDTFWTMGAGSQCSEAWDCISRYVYAALQGGSIMRGWTNDERMMIACCNDGTRPVIFKVERIDYRVLHVEGLDVTGATEPEREAELAAALRAVEGVADVSFDREGGWVEVVLEAGDVTDEALGAAVRACDGVCVIRAD